MPTVIGKQTFRSGLVPFGSEPDGLVIPMSQFLIRINNRPNDLFGGTLFTPVGKVWAKAHPYSFNLMANITLGRGGFSEYEISLEFGNFPWFGNFRDLSKLLWHEVTVFHHFACKIIKVFLNNLIDGDLVIVCLERW